MRFRSHTPWARSATQVSLILLLITAAAAGAARASSEAGCHAFEFLRLPAEPAGRSLAGAHLASVTGPASMAWNPAGLSRYGGSALTLAHATWFAETDWNWGALALRLPGNGGSLGFSCGLLRAGRLPGYTAVAPGSEIGEPTGEFTPMQLSGSVGYGRPLGARWNVGVALEMAFDGDGRDEPLQTWAVSSGVQLLLGRLTLGLAALHLGPPIEVGETRYRLPATYRTGGSLALAQVLHVHAAAEWTTSGTPTLLAGAEWRPVASLTTFGGLHYDREAQTAQLREKGVAATAGVALSVGRFDIAYGYQPRTTLEASHQLAVTLPLGSGAR